MGAVSQSVKEAVRKGDVQFLESIAGQIDWVDLAAGYTHSLGEILLGPCYDTENRDGSRSAALALMRKAAEDGCTALFRTWEVDQGGVSFVAPVLDFIEGDFPEALVAFMDQGFDPTRVYGIDGHNTLTLAMEQGNEGAQATILAYLARAKAHSILKDMFQEVKVAKGMGA